MGGRPKGSKDRLPRGSLNAAWLAVTQAELHLLEDAIRAGLTAARPSERLGFLELGAKLLRTIGPPEEPHAKSDSGVNIVLSWCNEADALETGSDQPAIREVPLRALPR